jgi:hypothetical protein
MYGKTSFSSHPVTFWRVVSARLAAVFSIHRRATTSSYKPSKSVCFWPVGLWDLTLRTKVSVSAMADSPLR